MAGPFSDKIKEFLRPETLHFVKFFLESPGQGRVQIPRKFMNKIGDDDSLGKVVILRDAAGKEWAVELLKNDEGVWLHKGWEEFQDFYSLRRFYFLMFRYDGNSQFSVTICDGTTTEIDYPVTSPRRGNETARFDEEKEEGGNGEPNPGISRGFARALSLLRRASNGLPSEGQSSRTAPPPIPSLKPDPETGDQNVAPFGALDKAKLFKSEDRNPFFIYPISTSSVTKAFRVNIPKHFVKLYLPKNRVSFYKLRPADGRNRRWPAARVVTEKNNGRIAGGWKKFALENKVVVGNVCIFEMVPGEKAFIVHVLR